MDTIKAEYRDQALALHGDKGGASQQKEEAMALLNDAKATLLDPDALRTRDVDPLAPPSFPAPSRETRAWLREKRAEATR